MVPPTLLVERGEKWRKTYDSAMLLLEIGRNRIYHIRDGRGWYDARENEWPFEKTAVGGLKSNASEGEMEACM